MKEFIVYGVQLMRNLMLFEIVLIVVSKGGEHGLLRVSRSL